MILPPTPPTQFWPIQCVAGTPLPAALPLCALCGCVALFCELFDLRFKFDVSSPAPPLRHAGCESVARGKRHKLAAVGQHRGVTLHSRHEDANPAVPARAANLGLHR